MDTSETYIKMCDCPEVQDKWFIKDGDWVGSEYGVVSINHINEDNKYYSSVKFQLIREDNTWLPRQDQIQEMCRKRHLYYLLKDIQIFQVKHTKGCGITTMEQLWLAFYMHEKHGKVWDGEKWIKK